jgi:hypothetical protein
MQELFFDIHRNDRANVLGDDTAAKSRFLVGLTPTRLVEQLCNQNGWDRWVMRPLLRLGKSPMTELSAHEEAAGLDEPLEVAMAHFARTTMIDLRSHAAAHLVLIAGGHAD